MGRLLFWLVWPFTWIYSPIFRRVRVVIRAGDSVVLVQKRFGPGYWQLPGGGIKFGETVLAAAKRETEEELGLEMKVSDFKQLNEDVQVLRQSGLLMRYNYVSLLLTNEQNLNRSKELINEKWAPLNQLEDHKLAKEVAVGLRQL